MAKNKVLSRSTASVSKKLTEISASSSGLHPIWDFSRVDRNGPFAFNVGSPEMDVSELLNKIVNYSSMTWAEIMHQTHDEGRSRNHFLDPSSLSKDAKMRLSACDIGEDQDNIFSLALTNTKRLIGLRENAVFIVLWYDPTHKFCPSTKKHT